MCDLLLVMSVDQWGDDEQVANDIGRYV
jgi:hypothetical protein